MQQKSELPEGWAECQIKDIVVINYGKGLKKSDRVEGQFDVFGSNGIVGKHNQSLTNGPTVIIGRKGSVGEINLSSEPCWPIDTTYYIDNFYGINRIFLYYLLKTLNLANYDTSTAIPGINRNDIYSQLVPLPPLSEQHRIVSAIEALFARLDATNEKLDRVPGILKKFRQSVLAAACDGRLTEDWRKANPDIESAKELVKSIIHEKETKSEKRKVSLNSDLEESVVQNIPESWFESSLDKISIKITDGTHHSPPNGAEGDFKYITAKNIKNDGIDLKNVTYVSSEVHDEIYSRCNPEYGDLLLIKDGATTGIVTLNNLTEPFSMLSSVALLKFPEEISNKYIMYYMRSPDFQSNVLDKMGGAAITRLTLKKISNMIIALPPLPEQQEIVHRVDALFAFADSIEAKVVAAREKTERLRQSILAKAFSGKLVETEAGIARREGREYEMAEVLLERIKEERGKGGKK
ncbi:restriction endonuclease subunit S [Methanosarcina mazei]|uniref:Type I restriction-modification system specificity subunit n=1 Tax=Methanosarcina mazei TaxID=2209 RepID=A0A0F8K3E5_METMZ|nr:restriction endonuclease subunit S [Methanosarcina mazei]KKG75490.1 type I restriction-modification system specificity subunit [Methanosarcina mazei]